MKKHNKKNASKTLSGQRGKYLKQGKVNNTLSKGLKVLGWIYDRTLKGKTSTAFGSFNYNKDTSFRTHVSVFCRQFGLEIPRKKVMGLRTWHKEYWLSANDTIKVRKILNKE